MNRTFHIGDILSAYTGRLMSPRHIEGVYDILDFLHQDKLFTHQLPRASRDARHWLEESLPWLKGITCEEVTPENIWARLAYYEAQFGKEHCLSPIPYHDELHRDPLAEAEEMAPGRVIKIEYE